MGNFLVVMGCEETHGKAANLFYRGVQLAGTLWGEAPTTVLSHGNVWAAGFARRNGSGGTIYKDLESGDWLSSAGTWFHSAKGGQGVESNFLKAIRDQGAIRAARELEGFFTIITGSPSADSVVVLTDIIGSHHAFQREWGGIVALSGSSLLLAALEETLPDVLAYQEFLSCGIIYEDRTLHREVRKLKSATCYTYYQGRLRDSQRYWDPTDFAPDTLTGDKAVKAVKDTLIAVCRQIAKVFDRPVCDLTGGYDSRALVAGFLAAGANFCTTVSGPASSPDVMISAELARREGLNHLRLEPDPIESLDEIRKALPLTDGEYDSVEYARVQSIHIQLSKLFDISLNGSFGEVARGYWWEILFPRTGIRGKLDAARVARLRYLPKGIDENLIPRSRRIDLLPHLVAMIERINSGMESLPNTCQMDHVYLALRMQRWQGRIASSTNRIWPCLSPFMMRSLIEVLLQIPFRLRRRSLLIRKLLPELNLLFAYYPLEHGYPPLPVGPFTLYRFWPIIPIYAGKVTRRVAMASARKETGTGPASTATRLQLWKQSDVIEMLQPKKMLSTAILDGDALTPFLDRSRYENFAHPGQWGRVLTLELLLRTIQELRSRK